MKCSFSFLFLIAMVFPASAAEPMSVASSYWKDPAFIRSFTGSYRMEARIEPPVTSEQRALLAAIQKSMEKGQRDVAIEMLVSSSLTKDSPALQFTLGQLYFEKGDIGKAITQYQKALKAYPSFRRAHRNLAIAWIREENTKAALPHLIEAIQLGDASGITYGHLGYCRLINEEYASALQAYRMALLTEPNVAEWKAGIARCLQQTGEIQEAILLLDEAVKQQPYEKSYALILARLHENQSNLASATKALELPSRLGLLSSEEKLELASLYLRSDLETQAREQISDSFSNPKAPAIPAILRTFEVTAFLGKWDLAEELLEKLEGAEKTPSIAFATARYLIGSEKNREKGLEILEELLTKDPTNGKILMALATERIADGEWENAELLLVRASLDPASALSAYVEKTKLFAKRGLFPQAISAIESALAISETQDLLRYKKALEALVEAKE